MLKLLTLIILINTARCDMEKFKLPNYSSAMTRAIFDFVSNFYYSSSSTVNMYHISQPLNYKTNLDVMNQILFRVKTEIVVQVDSLMNFKLSKRKRVDNIIFVDSFESFKVIFDQIDYVHFEYQGYYLVVLTDPKIDSYMTMLNIFRALWSKKILNVNILFMLPGNTNDAYLFTYYPYSKYYCEDAIPIQLNQYRGNSWMRQIDYFPKKLTNFFGCRLQVATFNNAPFMMIKEDKKTGAVTVDGIDGIVLRVLAQRLNFHVNLHVKEELFGYIFKNGTTTGATKMIVDNTANFTLGFFASMPMRDAIMQPSYVYFTTNLLWIVPPGKKQTSLEKLANPLKYIIWILTSLIILIGFIVIAVIKMQSKVVQKFVFGNKIQSPGMNFVNVILGNSLHQVPMRNFSRFLFLVATISFFIIRTCYTGGLVKFMQMDTRGPRMMTTTQMVEENFTFYLKDTGTGRDYVLNLPEVLKRVKLLPNPDFGLRMNEMTTDPYMKGAFLTTTGHLAYRNRNLYPKLFHEYAPNPIYTLNIVIYMNLGSCLRDYFNDKLMKFVSSGLINRWASQFIDERYLKKPVDDHLKSLNLEQLEGAFELFICGLFMGFIAFCVELLIGKKIGKNILKLSRLLSYDRKLFIKSKKHKPRHKQSKTK